MANYTKKNFHLWKLFFLNLIIMLQAYSVPAFVFAFVSFMGGCLFAVCNYKYLYVSKLQFLLYKLAPDGLIGKKRNPFCELEVKFLVELLGKKKINC